MPTKQLRMLPAKYSFDASALINPWRRYYPRDVFPGVWRDVEALVEQGLAVCTEEVLQEIAVKDDLVHEWLDERQYMVVSFDEEIEEAYRTIVNTFRGYASRGQYKNQADPFVVALALCHNLIVVTEETRDSTTSPPRIPNVCAAFDVECLSIVEMMRRERWKYA